jgi:hypothetical protein
MRQHGSKLLSTEFDKWLEVELANPHQCDARLLEVIREQKHSPQVLFKLQREMASRLKKASKRRTVVDRQFVALELFKPGMQAVLNRASRRTTKDENRKKLKQDKRDATCHETRLFNLPQPDNSDKFVRKGRKRKATAQDPLGQLSPVN